MMFDISETETILKNTVDHLLALTEQYEDICIDDEDGQELAARHLRAIEKAALRVVAMDGILVELKQKPQSVLASPASRVFWPVSSAGVKSGCWSKYRRQIMPDQGVLCWRYDQWIESSIEALSYGDEILEPRTRRVIRFIDIETGPSGESILRASPGGK